MSEKQSFCEGNKYRIELNEDTYVFLGDLSNPDYSNTLDFFAMTFSFINQERITFDIKKVGFTNSAGIRALLIVINNCPSRLITIEIDRKVKWQEDNVLFFKQIDPDRIMIEDSV